MLRSSQALNLTTRRWCCTNIPVNGTPQIINLDALCHLDEDDEIGGQGCHYRGQQTPVHCVEPKSVKRCFLVDFLQEMVQPLLCLCAAIQQLTSEWKKNIDLKDNILYFPFMISS